MKQATAYANANIALIKYWGKNRHPLNIPAVPSLSMTLNDMGTTVTVLESTADHHELFLNNKFCLDSSYQRLCVYLEQIRNIFPYVGFLRVSSESTIPVAAGLASSAAFYAALAVSLNAFFKINLDQCELSKIARMGSGSAARSIFGGFVSLNGGVDIDHNQAFAYPLTCHESLDLAMVIAVVSSKEKAVSSREAMILTKNTSPFFSNFIRTQSKDFNEAQLALKDGLFTKLGEVMEHSTLKMFATMWTARPPIIYWHPNSLAIIDLVKSLRNDHGPIAYFTMDAGPNVKILCQTKDLSLILSKIAQSQLAEEIRCSSLGQGAYVIESI